ncbi:hypothetical protein HY969_00135 [Candidatus Kaiserbacteria bacterium]|nr:hypothetical protein [Candidatus Kaiserbacteria bacterium]
MDHFKNLRKIATRGAAALGIAAGGAAAKEKTPELQAPPARAFKHVPAEVQKKLLSFPEFEAGILHNSIPLEKQMTFIKHALQKGGKYYKCLTDENTDNDVRKHVLEIVETASENLTDALNNRGLASTLPPELAGKSDITPLQIAAEALTFETQEGADGFSNGYYANVENEAGEFEPLFVAPGHHVKIATERFAKPFFTPEGERFDNSIRRPKDGEIPSPEQLPVFDSSVTDASVLGEPVGVYWVRKDGEPGFYASFAMPVPTAQYTVPEDAYMISFRSTEARLNENGELLPEGISGGHAVVLTKDGWKSVGPVMRHTDLNESARAHAFFQKPDAMRKSYSLFREHELGQEFGLHDKEPNLAIGIEEAERRQDAR